MSAAGDQGSGPTDPPRLQPDRTRRGGRPWVGFLVGLAAVAFGFVIVTKLVREELPALTEEILEANHVRWRALRWDDYDVRVTKLADRLDEEVFDTVVRAGAVESVSRNGAELPRPTDAYTIEGLFDIMRRELEMASPSGIAAEGAREGALLEASFDPERGFPLRFRALAGKGRSFVIGVERLATPEGGVVYSRNDTD